MIDLPRCESTHQDKRCALPIGHPGPCVLDPDVAEAVRRLCAELPPPPPDPAVLYGLMVELGIVRATDE